MKRSRATFIASLLLLVACSDDEEPRAKESDWQLTFDPPAAVSAEPGARFVDVAEQAGIDFVHVSGAQGRKYLPETMGGGVGMFDYDSDGDVDLLFVQSGEWEGSQHTMRLYRNDGAWKFTDVTQAAGLAIATYGMGLSIADYDADGRPDVYVTSLGKNLLLRNVDGRRFERVAGAPDGGTWTDKDGTTHDSWSTGAAWFDADGDGDLDLFVVSYVRWTPETDIEAQLVEGIKAYTRPQLYEGDAPRLYLQQDDHTFVDATEGSGFDQTKGKGKSLAVCLDDFDGDGKVDLFVANDTVQNYLFLNRGGGKFEEVAVAAAVAYDDNGQARAAMGLDSVDWRNDGRLSVAIGNFSEEPVSLFTVTAATEQGVLFEDAASEARIGHPTLLPLTFGLVMADLDLDGWCDLVLANGHIEPSVSKLKQELHYEQAPQYFRNLQGKRFVDVSLDAGPPFSKRIVGRGLAAGDLDGDGDLDLVFTSVDGAPMVLRNDRATENRSLRLRLRQPGTRNPDALGAVVRVTAGGVTQRRAVRTGSSYLSQGERTLTFGLGGNTAADQVVVRWPDGAIQTVRGLAAGMHEIERTR